MVSLHPIALRRSCRRVMEFSPSGELAGRRFVLDDLHVGHRRQDGPDGEHVHDRYEAMFVLRGGMRCLSAGRLHDVGAGGVVMHPPFHTHASWASGADCLRVTLRFSLAPAIPGCIAQMWPAHPDMIADLLSLLGETETRQVSWRLRIGYRVAVLVSQLLGCPVGVESAADAGTDLASRVAAYLGAHLSEPIALADIAGALDTSVRTLIRHYREQAGVTVGHTLSRLRMERAAGLLLEQPEAPLARIGAQVGMPEPAYFCRRFRRCMGETPQRYRTRLAAGDLRD